MRYSAAVLLALVMAFLVSGPHASIRTAAATTPHAVLAAEGGALPRATVGRATSSDYRSTFTVAHPGAGDVWVHHGVPQSILKRHPGLFDPMEIHSLENLRGIPAGAINRQIHLGEIRSSWNEFYRTAANPTRADVLDWATQVDVKYGVFFNPPVL